MADEMSTVEKLRAWGRRPAETFNAPSSFLYNEAADRIEALTAALKLHHEWQCSAEGLTMKYEQDGQTKEVDITGEYGDSTMYEKTVEALNGV